MKTLSMEIPHDGQILHQIWRKGRIAVYARPMGNLELIFIREVSSKILPGGTVLPDREVYPSPSEWGKLAWSFDCWRVDHVLSFAEELSQLPGTEQAKLVGLCMRNNSAWRKHLGPLLDPALYDKQGRLRPRDQRGPLGPPILNEEGQ